MARKMGALTAPVPIHHTIQGLSMTKATSNAIDFLAAISGGTELFEVEGIGVELRSLTFAEVQQMGVKYANDNYEITFQTVVTGLVTPKLDAAQVEQMRQAKPGAITKISNRIMQLSGMTEDEKALGEDGGGSSAANQEPPI